MKDDETEYEINISRTARLKIPRKVVKPDSNRLVLLIGEKRVIRIVIQKRAK